MERKPLTWLHPKQRWPPHTLPIPATLSQCSLHKRNRWLETRSPHFQLATHVNPKRLKNHQRDFRCSMKKFTLTLITLRLCIHYNSALVIQVVKYFSIPLDFAYDGSLSVTAGRLSKLCFCVFFFNMHSTRYDSEQINTPFLSLQLAKKLPGSPPNRICFKTNPQSQLETEGAGTCWAGRSSV